MKRHYLLFVIFYCPLFVKCLLISADTEMVNMRQDFKAAIYEAEAILNRTLQLTAEDKNIIPVNKKHIVKFIEEVQSRGLEKA